jgi:dihydrofolate reductase
VFVDIKTSVYIATSLDGFIARNDGSIDWLLDANATVPTGEDCGYARFMASVDVLVMGRNTYEQVLTFDPWPYSDKRVVVLSTQKLGISAHLASGVSASSEAPAALLERLAREGAKHVYLDGGKTIQGFLAAGLVDQITVTVIPVLIRSGRSLFGTIDREHKLQLVSSKAYEFGFVQNTYVVAGRP